MTLIFFSGGMQVLSLVSFFSIIVEIYGSMGMLTVLIIVN